MILNKLNEKLKRVSSYKDFSEPVTFLLKLKIHLKSWKSYLNFWNFTVWTKGIYSTCTSKAIFLIKRMNMLYSRPQLCKIIKGSSLESIYLILNIALQIYLNTPASNFSTERSFSARRCIKNYLKITKNRSS